MFFFRKVQKKLAKPTTTVHVIRGTLHWAKVLGEPRLNTYSKEKEWSVDLTPDAKGLEEIVRIGIKDKLREPKDNDSRTEDFLSFRHREYRENRNTGERTKNEPIKIVDITGQAWPEDKLIGNGTIADVKFRLVDYGKSVAKGIYISAIRVLDHVPYEVEEFAPLGEDDEFAGAKPSTAKAADTDASDDTGFLEDDIPF